MSATNSDKCAKQFCNDFYIPRVESWTRKIIKQINKKNNFKYTKKQRKNSEIECKRAYCNPTCKGTIFQKGKSMPKIEELEMLKGKKK